MSVRDSSAQVQSVSGAAVSAVGAGAVLVAGGVVAAAWALGKLGYEAFRACQAVEVAVNQETILPTCKLAAELRAHDELTQARVAAHALSKEDALKVATLASLAATPFMVKAEAVHQPLTALTQAQSLADVVSARRAVLDAVRVSHNAVFMQTLTGAFEQAAKQVGLGTVRVLEATQDVVRLVAEDERGRAVVSEIVARPHAEPTIESEVVGVVDNSCALLLDSFYEALRAQGVQVAPRRRKATGGVAETKVARDFLKKKALQQQEARRQQLNAGRRNIAHGANGR
jgi:hypothetical protein